MWRIGFQQSNLGLGWDQEEYGFLDRCDMGVSKNNGTPKSSILIGFSIINHPFWVFSAIHFEKTIPHFKLDHPKLDLVTQIFEQIV